MKNVLEFLELSAQKNPNKVAVIEEDKKITYKELIEKSQNVGTYIKELGFYNEPVIIFMNKGIDALISFLGTVYSGNFYCLVNPEFPSLRINQIEEILKSKCVITNDTNFQRAKELFKDCLIYDIEELKKFKKEKVELEKIRNLHIDCNPLYINFTSGSTGVPKGVVISHRSVIDFINNFTDIFSITSEDVIGNQAPFDFDVSVKDIYSSLRVGATLVIISKSYFSNPAALLDYICENKITTLIWAVSALCLITTFHGLEYKVPKQINKILFSGEVMPLKHLREWIDHLPNAKYVNLYGPTEITCNCTYHIVDPKRCYDKIPIGKAFPNEKVFLIDSNKKIITEDKKVGEICVGGSSLALGYYNNLELTKKNFIQNPSHSNYLDLIYCTGDLGYYDDNNDIIFNGRKDFQIKYMGHRIELEEIEKSLMNCEEIIRSCCIFDEEKSKIYGFYIGNISKKELHVKLKSSLPIYMIPTKLIQIDKFPLNKNGKIDRKALMKTMEVTK